MTPSNVLPAPVLRAVTSIIGEPNSIERLGGMSSGGVYRARNDRQSVIAKYTRGVAEAEFYSAVVRKWPDLQRFTPTLLDMPFDDGQFWLLLEDIPHSLPPERRLADPVLLNVLRLIHQSSLSALHEPYGPYRPTWTKAATERALAALLAADATTVLGLLVTMRHKAQPLFDPHCPISGDPNPANWGLRDNGSIVLFDWERFSWGTPALDLAITVPGLGNLADFRRVAAVYSSTDHLPPEAVEQLAHEIALAKAWSVVEFLANNAWRGETTASTVAWVVQQFPGWVRQLARDLAID